MCYPISGKLPVSEAGLNLLIAAWSLSGAGFIKIEQLFKKVVQFKNIVLPSV